MVQDEVMVIGLCIRSKFGRRGMHGRMVCMVYMHKRCGKNNIINARRKCAFHLVHVVSQGGNGGFRKENEYMISRNGRCSCAGVAG